MGTNIRWPDPNLRNDTELQNHIRTMDSYLNELIRTLRSFDDAIFSQEDNVLFRTSRIRPFVEVSAAYSAGVNDSVVLADSSAATFAVSLPSALDSKNTFYDIKKIDTNGSTVVSVEGSGPELPVILNGSGRPSVTLFSDGSDYWII